MSDKDGPAAQGGKPDTKRADAGDETDAEDLPMDDDEQEEIEAQLYDRKSESTSYRGTIDDSENEEYLEGEEEEILELEEEEDVIHQEDYISYPLLSKNGTLPLEILEFHHSFGYDSARFFNLCVLEDDIIMFASGNYLHIYQTKTQTTEFIRSPLGGGFGHLVKNPNPDYNHVAVGINGPEPPILIYEWPTMEIIFVLREGTRNSFSHLNYSPDGLLLCSQGGEPDYNITVWNWRHKHIMLRIKSFFNDVIGLMFSPYCPGQLTTSGLGHIKFWKMAKTFTGLKLKGELGRFGKTEISDIIGVYPMPDEKVISGCEWGNILVWDESLIKIEVCRKNRARCHDGPITQFEYNVESNEIMSISTDGWVRVWYWETVELADPPEDDRFVEIDPIYEFNISDENRPVSVMSMIKQKADPSDPMWYAQDAFGGVWLTDLSSEEIPGAKPVQVLKSHSGPVVAIQASPCGNHLASLSSRGRLHLHNYETKRLILEYQFIASAGHFIWLPLEADPTCTTLAVGLSDGVLRIVHLSIVRDTEFAYGKEGIAIITQASKPHSSPITQVSCNPRGTILVTGSEDKTVFMYEIMNHEQLVQLEPIGFIEVPSAVSYITWKPNYSATILVCCRLGEFAEADLPEQTRFYTSITYLLDHIKKREGCFRTCKAEIRRELKVKEITERKAAKIERKSKELAQLKADNPAITYDDDLYLADSESTETLEELYIPPIPNRIIWAEYTSDKTIWLNMSGYDAGYIYEYDIATNTNISSVMIADADDQELQSHCYYHNKKYLVFGMPDGAMRLNRVRDENYLDLSDYWTFAMHDNLNGTVNDMCFSYDGKYMFSCGNDGNIFSYRVFPEDDDYVEMLPKKTAYLGMPPIPAMDIDDPEQLSLEGVKRKAQYDEKMRIANQKKNKVLSMLASHRNALRKLLKRNRALLPSQVIPMEEFEVDDRISWDLEEQLEAEMELVERKMAFDLAKSTIALEKAKKFFIEPIRNLQVEVKAVRTKASVKTFRTRKLDSDFFDARVRAMQKMAGRTIKEAEGKEPAPIMEEEQVIRTVAKEKIFRISKVESFLMGLSTSTIEFGLGVEINRVLRKYRERRIKQANRQLEWDELNEVKPNPNKHHPADLAALEEAKKSIGDYKLKTDNDYKVPEEKKHSTLSKYLLLLEIREEISKIHNDFNVEVFQLRESKVVLTSKVDSKKVELLEIHSELLPYYIRPLPETPAIDIETEFTERALKVRVITTDPTTGRKRRASTIYDRLKPIVRELDLEKEVLGIHGVEHDRTKSFTAVKTRQGLSFIDIPTLNLETLISLAPTDETETPWEIELKRLRQTRKKYEQDKILAEIDKSITQFDENVSYWAEQRIMVDVKAKFLQLFLLTVHQELIILKEFEANEEKMHMKVQDKINEKNTVVIKQNELKTTIDTRKGAISASQDTQKQLQATFFAAVGESKFSEFLKGIFKKKYKPPKDPNVESDEDSTESSDESDDDDFDAASLSSGDIGPIRLDENICPEGCDINLYNMAFDLRNKRHDLEMNEKEEQRQIDSINKEVQVLEKQIRIVEEALKLRREELAAYQRLKQQRLNDIDTTVILNLHQVQNLTPEGFLESFEDSLVFSRGAIGSLYNRVGELKQETDWQKVKHRKNQQHLWRMNQDCQVMEDQIRKLKESIEEVMYKKFNRIVDLDQLEEAILKKLVHDLRFRMANVQKSYDKEIVKWKDVFCNKQLDLSEALEQNTEKLEVLTVLQEESIKLSKVLKHQEARKEVISKAKEIEELYRSDMQTLRDIEKRQDDQLVKVRKEIRRLRLKCEPLPPITPRAVTPEAKSVSEDSYTCFSFSDFPPPIKKEPRYKAMYSAFHIFYTLMDRVSGQIGSSMLVSRRIVKEILCNVTHTEISRSVIEEVLMQVYTELGEMESAGTVRDIIEDILQRTMRGPETVLPIVDELLVKVIEQTPEFLAVKDIVNQLLDKADDEVHKESYELVYDVLKLILDNLPTDRTPEEMEASVAKMAEAVEKILPPAVTELTPHEELCKSIQRIIYDIIELIGTVPRETTMEVVEAMYPEDAPPSVEETIGQDIIHEIITRVMDKFTLSESAMQIAIEQAIKSMIEKIPERLIRIRYNLYQVAREMVRRMSITSMEIVRVKGNIIVNNLIAFIEREGPHNLTRYKIEQIVGNIIMYIKNETIGEQEETQEGEGEEEPDEENVIKELHQSDDSL